MKIILTIFNISLTLNSQDENQYQNLESILISDSLNTATGNFSWCWTINNVDMYYHMLLTIKASEWIRVWETIMERQANCWDFSSSSSSSSCSSSSSSSSRSSSSCCGCCCCCCYCCCCCCPPPELSWDLSSSHWWQSKQHKPELEPPQFSLYFSAVCFCHSSPLKRSCFSL